ncbi:tetratricopeptide repeat protein, partial [Actinobaculum suis]|uniref:tetratricopeptide repeat protein n=1 Tax=Actinobaculum suis TaxID=1657 RepID=UPI001E31E410
MHSDSQASATQEREPRRDFRSHRPERETTQEQRAGRRDPEVPESVRASDLDPQTSRSLKSLSKRTADRVARHLVYAGMMMDENPELAYEHAKAAYRQAARVDVVREALGIAAYLTGRYSEALRELRTYRRMTDDYSHAPLEADAERGLGKPEKALSFIAEVPLKRLSPAAQIELAIVTSGARADTGDYAGGLSVIERIKSENLGEELRARVELVKADRLAEVGQTEEAEELRRRWTPVYEGEGEVDLLMEIEEEPEEDQTAEEAATEDLAAGAGDEEAAQDEAAAVEAAGV